MNKQDLVEALSARLQKSQKEASDTIDVLVDEIKKAIGKGEAIRISGFGAFEQTLRSARQGRNPRTGEPVKIAPTRVVRFRPAEDFKAIVAGTRKAVAAAVPGGGSESAKSAEAPAAEKAPEPQAAVTKTAATKATPAKKTTAKKATPAKKTTAKKTTARKAAAKKASPTTARAAKSATAATKATAQKAMAPTTTTAKKSTAKAAPAKRTAARKSAVATQEATAPE